ncbi:MAG: lysine--tRNA ligase [Candidatus Paceibacterota bacterium]|jgi:lysyl-tRNA synthetase, class II
MASLEEIRKERLRKLDLLKQAGFEPYPAKTEITHSLSESLNRFDELATEQVKLTVGGRVMALRVQGALAFFDLFDGTGKLQALLKKDDTPEKFKLLEEAVDIGDFIQVSGVLFTTKRGEKTVAVEDWKMLAKSLRPLPEKWAGLQDEEERLRKRYLDILTDSETREVIEKRSVFWQTIRQFLLERGFKEVDTPILENMPGGAEARPFVTHHNALDLDVYLRIAPELWLKRLLVAGLPKVFEIGRVFRNEGIDAEHLQDYQVMEFYWAYVDYEQGMKLVEELYKEIAQKTFGTLQFKIRDFAVDLGKPWARYDYTEIIKEKTGVDIMTVDLSMIEKRLQELAVNYDKDGFNLNRAIDNLWKYCRKQIAGPGFLVNVPVMMEPLAKRRADNPNIVERFQVILAGSENGKGFSELNDPQDQLGRFEEQDKLRVAGDEEAQRKDDDFIEALEYGMPPACGFGLSERLFSFLLDKPVREGQVFPLLRPKK